VNTDAARIAELEGINRTLLATNRELLALVEESQRVTDAYAAAEAVVTAREERIAEICDRYPVD
jgi:hypothetical protein